MENPAGGMEKMWFMSDWQDKKKIVDLCAYAWPFKKTTNLWVNGFKFEPKGNTGQGRCKEECGQGALNAETNRFRHYMALAVDPERGPRGAGAAQMTCGMPQQLIIEILKAVKATAQVSGKVVVDLCAGFQSLREEVEKAGARYIAVDIKGRRQPEKLNTRSSAVVLIQDGKVLVSSTENTEAGLEIVKGNASNLNTPTHSDAVKELERVTGLSEASWRTRVVKGPRTRALKDTTYYIYKINPIPWKAVGNHGQTTPSRNGRWVRAEEVAIANGWRSEDVQIIKELNIRVN